ncbi:MAG: hypothetical protein Q9160_002803 [Pyrenula sp. 1 TL-2023]
MIQTETAKGNMALSLPTTVQKNAKKKKGGTLSTKNHRFEPFSQRIARLKIDPVHRVKANSFAESNTLAKSHFRTALEHWGDLNASTSFTEFLKKVSPLCENLPQLLHHADQINGLLLDYVGRGDALSAEPLLDLLAQFARDLGVTFEKYFLNTVQLVASVASSHEAPEVIEWTFTCLAWIFKFLSRLLVPDLRPLLSVMLPYLGTSRQKWFVSRFAAESMVYLLRKAAIQYQKNPSPLQNVIVYLFEALRQAGTPRETQAFRMALMTLLSEAIRGVAGGIHSSGNAIFSCLLQCATDASISGLEGVIIVRGTLIGVLHQSTAEGAAALTKLITEYALRVHTGQNKTLSEHIAVETLLVLSATRKGYRIHDWKNLNSTVSSLLKNSASISSEQDTLLPRVMLLAAQSLTYSPLDELLPFLSSVPMTMLEEPLCQHFPYFCQVFADLAVDRFREFVTPTLQRFVLLHWKGDGIKLLLMLLQLAEKQAIHLASGKAGSIDIPTEWIDTIVASISHPDDDQRKMAVLYARLQFLGQLNLPLPTRERLFSTLLSRLREASSSPPGSDTARFMASFMFKQYMEMSTALSSSDATLWESIYKSMPSACSSRHFLEGLCRLFSSQEIGRDDSNQQTRDLVSVVTENLLKDSNKVKAIALRLLKVVLAREPSSALQALDLAFEIQQTPFNLQTVRGISMLVRKLQSLQTTLPASSPIYRAIALFLLGLLAENFPPLTDDICASIGTICEAKVGENIVMPVLIDWLKSAGDGNEALCDMNEKPNDSKIESKLPLSEFECSNVDSVETSAREYATDLHDPDLCVTRRFEAEKTADAPRKLEFRTASLKALNAIPNVAERWSKSIVPIFLSVFQEKTSTPDSNDLDINPSSNSQCVYGTDWPLLRRKDFITLFSKFVNPKVLYLSSDVYETLMGIIASGSSQLQQLGLKAIYCWRSQAIRPYEDMLLSLTDERKYREELAKVFHADNETAFIQPEHRSQLLPLMLRVLYGQAINRPGSRSNHADQSTKRKTVLRVLSRLQTSEVSQFISMALGPLTSLPSARDLRHSRLSEQDVITQDHQHGLLNMILSMLEILQGQLNEHIEPILNAVMYCLIRACRVSSQYSKNESDVVATHSPARRNRRLALRCLVSVFNNMPEIEWDQYVPVIFSEVISPRLPTLPIENAQGVSGLLELCATWASSPRYFAFLVEYESALLDALADCLAVPSAQEDVLIFVLDRIFTRIARAITAAEDFDTFKTVGKMTQTAGDILESRMKYILAQIGHLLEVRGGRRLLDSIVSAISSLTPIAKTQDTSISILTSISNLLSRPLEKVGPNTRSQLLQAMHTLLSLHSSAIDPELRITIFSITAAAFSRFKASKDRIILCQILTMIASSPTAKKVASLCDDLNAMSRKKLDEIDYDRRLAAFSHIQESLDELRNPELWPPIMHNLLYFALHAEDFAIRSHTVASIKTYIKVSCNSGDPRDQDMRKKVLLPGLKKGLKESSESVRADHVGLLGTLITINPNLPELSDLEGLLAHNDEEASFFNNVLHIQHHRRVRALRRLTAEVESGTIRSSNISSIFLPLVEKFVFDTETADKDQSNGNNNLVGPSVETIATLTAWTEWGQFRQILLRYKSYLRSKPSLEKNVIKLLSACAESLHQAISASARSGISPEEGGTDNNDAPANSRLSTTLPSTDKIGVELMENVIPELTSYVHNKDESEISLRVPLCIAVTKLVSALDTVQEAHVLPPLLLDIAYILRSRSQDSRDTARKTLSQIVTILGRRCLPFVLKELRTALTRGYQLHVLSYTVHSILVSTEELFSPGDIDTCLPSLVAIVMDDIFGVVGQEKEAEEYTRKSKEVKSSKSYDSMELIARSISLGRLIQLISPVQSLLRGRLTARQAHQVDELLRRVSLGLARNLQSRSKDLLVLVYQIIQKFYSDTTHQREPRSISSEDLESRYLIQLSRPAKTETIAQDVVPTKLMRFSLDLLRSVLLKHEELCTPENLDGFIPVIGDALLQSNEEVKISAIRLLSVIVKLPLPGLDNDAQLFISEAVKVIKDAVGTNGEAFQAALKLVTSYLRDRRQVTVRDSDLAYLLKRIIPDVEEPDRQGVIFNFVKALMARQIVMPEVYELLDKVAVMMVTNHTRNARDVARGAFVYFLVEYPQSRGRWSKQLKFLVKNLEYKYPEGRQSVMEAVNVILSRSKGDVSKDITDALFIPIVLMMVNDESSECRSMAGALLGQFFRKAEADHVDSLVVPIRSWLERTDNQSLVVAGLQVYEILLDTPEASHAASVLSIRSCILRTLKDYDPHDIETAWEPIYRALQLFNKLVTADPESVMAPASKLEWTIVARLSKHQHPWVKSAAANLIGRVIPLSGTHGLQLAENTMSDIMKSSLHTLKANSSSKELTSQCIRNLVFLGRCFNGNGVSVPMKANDKHLNKLTE